MNAIKVDGDKLQFLMNFIGEQLAGKTTTLGIIQQITNELIIKEDAQVPPPAQEEALNRASRRRKEGPGRPVLVKEHLRAAPGAEPTNDLGEQAEALFGDEGSEP